MKPTASTIVVLCCRKSSSCFKEYQSVISGANILGLVFKFQEISTAVSPLNKEICCTYEKTSKEKQRSNHLLIFFFNVYLKIAIKLYCKEKQDINCCAEFNPWNYRSCKSF